MKTPTLKQTGFFLGILTALFSGWYFTHQHKNSDQVKKNTYGEWNDFLGV